MTLYTHIGANIRRTWILFSIFFIVIIGLGWFLSYYFEDQSILLWAVGISIFMSFFCYWFSDKFVLGISGAKQIEHNQAPELYHLLKIFVLQLACLCRKFILSMTLRQTLLQPVEILKTLSLP